MSIELEIRWLRSPDVNDLRNWQPSSPQEIFYPLEIDLGQKGFEGANVFDVLVATPEALQKHWDEYKRSNRQFPDRNLLVFGEYSWNLVHERVKKIVKSCERDTWQESVVCLNRYFRWEYEDHNLFPPS